MVFCTQCGKQIPEDMKFCPYCGEPTGVGQTSPNSAPSQPAPPKPGAAQPGSFQPYSQQSVNPQHASWQQNAAQQTNWQQSAPQQPSWQQNASQQAGWQQTGAKQANWQTGSQQGTWQNAQPPFVPASPEPEKPKKKSKAPLIILLIILGLALLGGAIYAGIWYANQKAGDASEQDDESDSKQGKGGKDSSKKDESEEEGKDSSRKEDSSEKEESSDNESSEESAEESNSSESTASESSSEQSSEESKEPEPEPEPEPTVVFHIAPVGGITSVDEFHINRNMTPEWDYYTAWFERTGYPQNWTSTAIYSNNHYEAGVFQFAVGSGDSLRYGVMDYDGNILFEPILQQEIGPLWYIPDYLGVMCQTTDTYLGWVWFSSDYSTMTAQEVPPFGYETLPYYYYYNDELYFFDGEKNTGPVTLPETLKGSLVAITDSKMTYYGSTPEIGYYYIKSDGSKVEQYGYLYGIFANGYYAATEDMNGKKQALIDPTTGEPICEFMYDEVQYFVDGYCPVKRNGKWGLINEYGEEVISCCFDSMSSVYKGKIAVMLDGEFAVIDLTASLEDGAVLTKDIITKAFNDQAFTSGYVAPDPTQHFMVWIPYNNLYIRTGAGTNYSHLSYFIPPGAYEIVEVQSGTGSTAGWGKLANGDGWVALDFCFKF